MSRWELGLADFDLTPSERINKSRQHLLEASDLFPNLNTESHRAALHLMEGDTVATQNAVDALVRQETLWQAAADPVDPDCVRTMVDRTLFLTQREILDDLVPGWENSPPGPDAGPEARTLYEDHITRVDPDPCF